MFQQIQKISMHIGYSSATQNYFLIRIWLILDSEDQTELVAAYFRYTHL